MDHRPHCFAGFGCKCAPELAPVGQSPGSLIDRCLAAIGRAAIWLLRWP